MLQDSEEEGDEFSSPNELNQKSKKLSECNEDVTVTQQARESNEHLQSVSLSHSEKLEEKSTASPRVRDECETATEPNNTIPNSPPRVALCNTWVSWKSTSPRPPKSEADQIGSHGVSDYTTAESFSSDGPPILSTSSSSPSPKRRNEQKYHFPKHGTLSPLSKDSLKLTSNDSVNCGIVQTHSPCDSNESEAAGNDVQTEELRDTIQESLGSKTSATTIYPNLDGEANLEQPKSHVGQFGSWNSIPSNSAINLWNSHSLFGHQTNVLDRGVGGNWSVENPDPGNQSSRLVSYSMTPKIPPQYLFPHLNYSTRSNESLSYGQWPSARDGTNHSAFDPSPIQQGYASAYSIQHAASIEANKYLYQNRPAHCESPFPSTNIDQLSGQYQFVQTSSTPFRFGHESYNLDATYP